MLQEHCFLLEFQRKVLQQLEELKAIVLQNARTLAIIQSSGGSSMDLPQLPASVTLPVTSTRELELIEDVMKDDESAVNAMVCFGLYPYPLVLCIICRLSKNRTMNCISYNFFFFTFIRLCLIPGSNRSI